MHTRATIDNILSLAKFGTKLFGVSVWREKDAVMNQLPPALTNVDCVATLRMASGMNGAFRQVGEIPTKMALKAV